MAPWMFLVMMPAIGGGSVEVSQGTLIEVRGEVVDATSGSPIPCRVSIHGNDGAWFFPESASPDGSAVPYRKVANNNPSIVEMHTTLSAHPFTVRLSPGRYTLTVERGKEYHPERLEFTVGTEPVRVSVKLRRWIAMSKLGWYSGDTHVHRSLAELPNVMLAEDLNIAFPLIDWVREAFVPPIERRAASFQDPGPEPIRVDASHMIVPRNTEYELFSVAKKSHTLGAFFVLNHKTPLDLGAPPVGPVARRAKAEGALIELDKHNWPWSMAIVPVMPVDLFELSNNHVWQTDFSFHDWAEQPSTDMNVEKNQKGLTEWGWIDFGFKNYYALLDCGFRLRATAGTGSGVHPVPLGFGRVYVRLDGTLDSGAWLRGLNAGKSFVTTGPMLFVTLNGQDPGHHFDKSGDYQLAGSAESIVPLSRIEIVVNGQVFKTLKAANRKTDRGSFESPVEAAVPVTGTSWVAVRCFEDRPDGRVRFAHSGIFHIDVAGKPLRPRKAEVNYLIDRVESQIERSAHLLPGPAVDEYKEALRAYRAISESAR